MRVTNGKSARRLTNIMVPLLPRNPLRRDDVMCINPDVVLFCTVWQNVAFYPSDVPCSTVFVCLHCC